MAGAPKRGRPSFRKPIPLKGGAAVMAEVKTGRGGDQKFCCRRRFDTAKMRAGEDRTTMLDPKGSKSIPAQQEGLATVYDKKTVIAATVINFFLFCVSIFASFCSYYHIYGRIFKIKLRNGDIISIETHLFLINVMFLVFILAMIFLVLNWNKFITGFDARCEKAIEKGGPGTVLDKKKLLKAMAYMSMFIAIGWTYISFSQSIPLLRR